MIAEDLLDVLPKKIFQECLDDYWGDDLVIFSYQFGRLSVSYETGKFAEITQVLEIDNDDEEWMLASTFSELVELTELDGNEEIKIACIGNRIEIQTENGSYKIFQNVTASYTFCEIDMESFLVEIAISADAILAVAGTTIYNQPEIVAGALNGILCQFDSHTKQLSTEGASPTVWTRQYVEAHGVEDVSFLAPVEFFAIAAELFGRVSETNPMQLIVCKHKIIAIDSKGRSLMCPLLETATNPAQLPSAHTFSKIWKVWTEESWKQVTVDTESLILAISRISEPVDLEKLEEQAYDASSSLLRELPENREHPDLAYLEIAEEGLKVTGAGQSFCLENQASLWHPLENKSKQVKICASNLMEVLTYFPRMLLINVKIGRFGVEFQGYCDPIHTYHLQVGISKPIPGLSLSPHLPKLRARENAIEALNEEIFDLLNIGGIILDLGANTPEKEVLKTFMEQWFRFPSISDPKQIVWMHFNLQQKCIQALNSIYKKQEIFCYQFNGVSKLQEVELYEQFFSEQVKQI